MNQTDFEKRKFIRFETNFSIIVRKTGEKKWHDAKLRDLSLGGMGFKLNSQKDSCYFERFDPIEVLFDKQLYNNYNQPILGFFIWNESYSNNDTMSYGGIIYDNLSDEQKKLIKEIISKISKLFYIHYYTNSQQSYKILFIDDNKSLTKIFSMLGKEYNFKALVASSYEEGYEIAQNQLPDVILTDVHMPEKDGFILTAMLKTDERTKHIPIIGCSVTYPDSKKKMLILGACKFINDKPSTIEQLNRILDGVLPPLSTRAFVLSDKG